MVLQEFKGCGHNAHLTLALCGTRHRAAKDVRSRPHPHTGGHTELKCESLLDPITLVTSGPPTQQARMQPLTLSPCSSPSSSSSPSLPVSELGDGG